MSKKISIKSENCSQRDIKSSDPETPYKKIKEKLSTTWGIIGLGLSFIGSGFAAGLYCERTLNTLEYNDRILELNKEFLNVKDDNDKVIHELRNQVYELQKELLNQKKHNNEKKD